MAKAAHRLKIAIIGAGPGGICAGVRLKERGFENFVIFEKSPKVGGTWQNNRYPGAACDVESHVYSFSFALKPDWSRRYATQPEIRAYMEEVAERFGLNPHLRLSTAVKSARWDEPSATWRLTTADGAEHRFDAVISAIGMFNDLKWPDIDGLDRFEGTLFHSAEWPDDHDLTGRTVGVIGSAASAIQFVPEVAKQAGRTILFQRTANWVVPKSDEPFTPEEIERFRTDRSALLAFRKEINDLLETLIVDHDSPERQRSIREVHRQHIAVVEDPEIRHKLMPTHDFGCKRPLISNAYYPTFNRPDVELVTEGVARITPSGIVTTDGKERPVDTIVISTGFNVDRYLSAIAVTGRGGRHIEEAWSSGAEAYLGIATAGFPNLFMLYGPNTNNGSIIFMLECQVDYILRQLDRMEDEELGWIDVRPEVVRAYNDALQDDLANVKVWQQSCNNYYHVGSGRNVTQWPHGMTEYHQRTSARDEAAFESGPIPVRAAAE